MRRTSLWIFALYLITSCAHERTPYASTQSPLALSRVVLYRNGIAYFERQGAIDGDRLAIKVRKDQINDLLKSLTVIDRGSGKTLSVSIPLDPKAWQDAALAMLTPGRGRLAEVLDALRGTEVAVDAEGRSARGRIVMVERILETPEPVRGGQTPTVPQEDHRLTLLNGGAFEVLRLSRVRTITFQQGDLVMQLDRHLDATAGEGMFQQVDVVVRLADSAKHDLVVSYVAQAPLWKPTYRLVLSDDGSGKALLQAWAVVANVSGENWDKVDLSLTSGAPLAFRYDLHTPQQVERPDLTQSGVHKQAQMAFGEATYAPPPPPSAAAPTAQGEMIQLDEAEDAASGAPMAKEERSRREMSKKAGVARPQVAPAAPPAPSMSAVDLMKMASSAAPRTTARRVAGLTRFDIAERVTLPDGSASMVMLINKLVNGEEAFLFKPGGSGQGYEFNPYRVVRFQNSTEFVLEPGPISIYSGGSFVGEGLSESIASQDKATIPFAAEPSIIVHSGSEASGDAVKISRIVRGVIEVESFQRVLTTWTVQVKPSKQGYRVLVRQGRAGDLYTLVDPPKDTETLPDGYFIPVVVGPDQAQASLQVVERTPSNYSLSVWDDKAPELLKQLLELPGLDSSARAALQPVVDARQQIGRIDTELAGLSAQQEELDERAEEERQNLHAIQKDPKAGALRKRLSERLEELTQKAAEIGRRIVDLNSQRLSRKIELEDKLRELDLTTTK
ncbi:MAG TPA: DUF4139 domain-containing protein [Polyangiales bacterium]|nr:DUF4139 domain-containing protein [Polyangiales bacterium]